jgi:hypothetical protein
MTAMQQLVSFCLNHDSAIKFIIPQNDAAMAFTQPTHVTALSDYVGGTLMYWSALASACCTLTRHNVAQPQHIVTGLFRVEFGICVTARRHGSSSTTSTSHDNSAVGLQPKAGKVAGKDAYPPAESSNQQVRCL